MVQREFDILESLNWDINLATPSEIAKYLLLLSNPDYDFSMMIDKNN